MWVLTIRSPWKEPREIALRAGKMTLGRKPDSDIVISDDSASRQHAELEFDPAADHLLIRDLQSTNGTYVNRERIAEPQRLKHDDYIRIGQHVLSVSRRDGTTTGGLGRRLPGTQPLTRDLVLEAVDQHALVLYEVAMRLNTILDLDTALAEVSRLAQIAIGADRCEVVPAYRFDQLAALGFPTSLARQAIEQRAVIFLPDLSAAFGGQLTQSALLLRIRSVLCVPGMMGNEVVALTYVYRSGPESRPFDHSDLQLAVAISHQAALTIQRTQLLEKARRLEQLASVDSLTGLNNRRHFFELADKEFQRARRYGRPLAAMMLDIDAFKHVNDTLGHAAGDDVLRAVARALRNDLREAHLLGRYGGDEFAVILLECGQEQAEIVARRLRNRVAALPITTVAGTQQVTLSTGCSALAEATADLADLVNQADARLLVNKRTRGVGVAGSLA